MWKTVVLFILFLTASMSATKICFFLPYQLLLSSFTWVLREQDRFYLGTAVTVALSILPRRQDDLSCWNQLNLQLHHVACSPCTSLSNRSSTHATKAPLWMQEIVVNGVQSCFPKQTSLTSYGESKCELPNCSVTWSSVRINVNFLYISRSKRYGGMSGTLSEASPAV